LLELGVFYCPRWIRRVLVAFGGLRLEPRRDNCAASDFPVAALSLFGL